MLFFPRPYDFFIAFFCYCSFVFCCCFFIIIIILDFFFWIFFFFFGGGGGGVLFMYSLFILNAY